MNSQYLESRLTNLSGISWVCKLLDTCDSTMEEAKHLFDNVELDTPALVLSRSQSAGRGRQGREWVEASKGLYMTAVFSSSLPLAKYSGFSLVVGCAVKDTLKCLGYEVKLKWPNDILSPSLDKLGGILIEVHSLAKCTTVCIGVGINIAKAPAEVINSTALMDIKSQELSEVDLGSALASLLYDYWKIFIQEGFGYFKDAWVESAAYIGSSMRIDTGSEILEGEFAGVTDLGLLRLKSSSNYIDVVSGHILEIGK